MKTVDAARGAERLSVGLVGFGAIGQAVAGAVLRGEAGRTRLAAVLCRDPAAQAEALASLPDMTGVAFTADVDSFFSARPRLVIEAAGQEALREQGLRALETGADLLVTSIGAFADDELFVVFADAAERSGARLLLASGALPATDWMMSAALAGDCTAAITQSKPVASWRGTPAANLVDLESLAEPTCFFEGSAREAARRFPKSSNITAMLALVSAGLDATRVRLVADPRGRDMRTLIDFRSAAGALKVEWEGVPSDLNPKTSADVPLNVIKALRNLSGSVVYGP